jgi:hypothetical protein
MGMEWVVKRHANSSNSLHGSFQAHAPVHPSRLRLLHSRKVRYLVSGQVRLLCTAPAVQGKEGEQQSREHNQPGTQQHMGQQ